jgi:hypothetical protein
MEIALRLHCAPLHAVLNRPACEDDDPRFSAKAQRLITDPTGEQRVNDRVAIFVDGLPRAA